MVFPMVFSYRRAQALADGVLVDAGPAAYEEGVKVPVALNEAAWNDCGRLWLFLQSMPTSRRRLGQCGIEHWRFIDGACACAPRATQAAKYV